MPVEILYRVADQQSAGCYAKSAVRCITCRIVDPTQCQYGRSRAEFAVIPANLQDRTIDILNDIAVCISVRFQIKAEQRVMAQGVSVCQQPGLIGAEAKTQTATGQSSQFRAAESGVGQCDLAY